MLRSLDFDWILKSEVGYLLAGYELRGAGTSVTEDSRNSRILCGFNLFPQVFGLRVLPFVGFAR